MERAGAGVSKSFPCRAGLVRCVYAQLDQGRRGSARPVLGIFPGSFRATLVRSGTYAECLWAPGGAPEALLGSSEASLDLIFATVELRCLKAPGAPISCGKA
jgi:hypothetical protein